MHVVFVSSFFKQAKKNPIFCYVLILSVLYLTVFLIQIKPNTISVILKYASEFVSFKKKKNTSSDSVMGKQNKIKRM